MAPIPKGRREWGKLHLQDHNPQAHMWAQTGFMARVSDIVIHVTLNTIKRYRRIHGPCNTIPNNIRFASLVPLIYEGSRLGMLYQQTCHQVNQTTSCWIDIYDLGGTNDFTSILFGTMLFSTMSAIWESKYCTWGHLRGFRVDHFKWRILFCEIKCLTKMIVAQKECGVDAHCIIVWTSTTICKREQCEPK